MLKLTKEMHSPHSRENLFDLVNKTDSYHLFVPFCSISEVLESQGDEKICRLVFAHGPISQELITRNVLSRPNKIEVHLHRGPFTHLYGEWRFIEKHNGTMVKLYFEYEFSNYLIQTTFGRIFKSLSSDLVRVFCERADAALH